MSTDDRIEVYYPVWVQLISVIGLPALGLAGLWLLTRPLWEGELGMGQFLAGAVFGAAVLYQCVIGSRALPYLRVRITASEPGVEVVSGRTRRTFVWKEFALPKDYAFASTTRLSLRTGEVIIYAFDNMKNLEAIKALIGEQHAAPE